MGCLTAFVAGLIIGGIKVEETSYNPKNDPMLDLVVYSFASPRVQSLIRERRGE